MRGRMEVGGGGARGREGGARVGGRLGWVGGGGKGRRKGGESGRVDGSRERRSTRKESGEKEGWVGGREEGKKGREWEYGEMKEREKVGGRMAGGARRERGRG